MNNKCWLKFLVLGIVSTVINASPVLASIELSDTAKEPDGLPLYMRWPSAREYCKNRGQRLPTSREFSYWATDHGAKGIRETAYPDLNAMEQLVQTEIIAAESDLYFPVARLNSQSEVTVDYYFNGTGFKWPFNLNDEARFFWTDSYNPKYPSDPYLMIYVFDRLDAGFIGAPFGTYSVGTRCVLK